MRIAYFIVVSVLLSVFLQSCIVQAPYAEYDAVMKLRPGMTIQSLEDSLGLEPYYIERFDNSNSRVYVYKYRLCDLKRIPILQGRNKGWEVPGDYVNLLVNVGPDDIVYGIETSIPEKSNATRTTVIDFKGIVGGLTTMITVTLPALLIFLSNEN